MQFQKTRLSEAIGSAFMPRIPRTVTHAYPGRRAWPMTDIVNWGVDLDQWDPNTWHYSAQFDVVFVDKGSKLYIWLCLH